MNSDYALRTKELTKNYPGVRALDKVNFSLSSGEIRGLIGMNGAGKSTLMELILGTIREYEGEIYIKGKNRESLSSSDVINLVNFISQEPRIVPDFTVGENINLGNEPFGKSSFRKDELNAKAEKCMENVDVDISLDRTGNELSPIEKQIVNIVQSLITNPEILLMDEPTSSLSQDKKNIVFDVAKSIKEKGGSVIFVAHDLNEIFKISDTITVLKDGKKKGTYDKEKVSREKIVRQMTGESEKAYERDKRKTSDETNLQVENLKVNDGSIDGIDFSVGRSEILGIVGVRGCGKKEIGRVLGGDIQEWEGSIISRGEKIKPKDPAESLNAGIFYLTEEWSEGLIGDFSVKGNITLSSLRKYLSKIIGWIDSKREKKVAKRLKKRFEIDVPSINSQVNMLSGGNKQKVMIGKATDTDANILILHEPTKGIDVKAKYSIHAKVEDLADEGNSIIWITNDLDEVLGYCDKLLVIFKGNQVGIFPGKVNKEKVMSAMLGGNGGEDKK